MYLYNVSKHWSIFLISRSSIKHLHKCSDKNIISTSLKNPFQEMKKLCPLVRLVKVFFFIAAHMVAASLSQAKVLCPCF